MHLGGIPIGLGKMERGGCPKNGMKTNIGAKAVALCKKQEIQGEEKDKKQFS